jgi:hypothetical protein
MQFNEWLIDMSKFSFVTFRNRVQMSRDACKMVINVALINKNSPFFIYKKKKKIGLLINH